MNDVEYVQSVDFLLEKARTDFLTYVLLFHPQDGSRGKFILSDFHKFLIAIVQGVVDGDLQKRQAISCPPQHGKSSILSLEAPSWLLGRFPDTQIAITGYSHTLTTDFSRAIRDRVEDDLYKMIFPGVELTPAHSQVNNWRATNQSGVIARSVRSKLTGRKVDWLIVDDPHAGRDEAESVTMREKVHRWYFGDCVTRLSPGASVFMIQTRWHPHDLIGKLIDVDYREELRTQGAESELFQVVNLPAVCEDEENDPLGRKEGEALFPQVRNETFLNAVRATIPSYEWESQYMGRPRSASTNMINVDAIEIIEPEEVPEGIMKTRGWDTALTEKQTSDWSVGAKCGILFPTSEEVSERKKAGLPPPLPTFYILDLYREKLNWPKLKAKMQAVALADLQNDGIGRIGMEAVAGFEAAYMEIRQLLLGRVTVERRNPVSRGGKVMDKLMRAQAWINLVEAGQVKMVRARWNKDLRSEMEVFPEGEHDDQIDAITIAYEVFTMGKLLLA